MTKKSKAQLRAEASVSCKTPDNPHAPADGPAVFVWNVDDDVGFIPLPQLTDPLPPGTRWIAQLVELHDKESRVIETAGFKEPEAVIFAYRRKAAAVCPMNGAYTALFDSILQAWSGWQPPLMVQVDLDSYPLEQQADVLKAVTSDDGGQEFLEKHFFAELLAKRKAAA